MLDYYVTAKWIFWFNYDRLFNCEKWKTSVKWNNFYNAILVQCTIREKSVQKFSIKCKHLLTDREIVQQIGHSLFRDHFSVWIVFVFEARFGSRAWFGNYPPTPFSFILCFNLPILASPRVLHREQRRKIPSACMGVRGRFYTPADTQRTRPG